MLVGNTLYCEQCRRTFYKGDKKREGLKAVSSMLLELSGGDMVVMAGLLDHARVLARRGRV